MSTRQKVFNTTSSPVPQPQTTPTNASHHAKVSRKQLERLRDVFDGSVFDTSGNNSDVLKLLLTTCRTLVNHSIDHTEHIDQLQTKTRFVEGVEAKVTASHGASEAMSEAVKRINFMWAAQGLSDFAINNAPSMAKPVGGGLQSAQPYDPDVVAADQHAAQVLQQSYTNMALADDRIRSFETRAETSELSERVSILEKVVEGIHGVCSRVQAETIKLNETCNILSRDFDALEKRFSLNVEAMQRTEAASKKNVDAVGKEIDGFSRKISFLNDQISESKKRLEQHMIDTKNMEVVMNNVKAEKTSVVDVKATVSLMLNTTTKPLANAVENLYKLLDIAPTEAEHVCELLPPTSGDPQSIEEAAMNIGKSRLKLVHSGVPFKAVLSAIRFMNDSVRSIQDKVEVISSKVPSRPLIGLELADGSENDGGVVVTRVFEELAAKRAGVREGDVIIASQQQKVSSREDFNQILSTSLSSNVRTLELHVLRNGHVMQLVLDLSPS